MFETRTTFLDSLFYDVSSWTLPLAFDVNFEKINDLKFIGKLIQDEQKLKINNVEMVGLKRSVKEKILLVSQLPLIVIVDGFY